MAANNRAPRRSRAILVAFAVCALFVVLGTNKQGAAVHTDSRRLITQGRTRGQATCNDGRHESWVLALATFLGLRSQPRLDRVARDLIAALNGSAAPPGRAPVWLQIGANTMDRNNRATDPLIRLLDMIPSWRKVFVEPIPQLFSKLQESIKRWPNAQAINFAIAANDTIKAATMYCPDNAFEEEQLGKSVPFWANQICSFNVHLVGMHFPGGAIREVHVKAVTLPALLARLKLDAVDVLMIDTEGFDSEVVRQIPFDTIRPSLVVWEHKHLQDRGPATEAFMRSHCYSVWQADGDNTAAVAL